MYGGKTVSVVLPAYNEALSIRAAVEDFFIAGVVDEVVVVDNNSRDGTAEEAGQTRARVVHEPAQGYGHALRRGLREAQGDLVILAEPDGTFVGRDVLKLLAYADDFDMVCGTRTTRELVWEWSLPFAARPPFASSDLTRHVTLLYPEMLHCCRTQWEQSARDALETWVGRADAPPVVVLEWDATTGKLSKVTDREQPFLRSVMLELRKVTDPSAFRSALMGVIDSAR